MTVALGRDVGEFLQSQVQRGVCADASELLNDVIRSLRQQQEERLDVTPEPENWLLEAADQPSTLLTRDDYNSLRERVRARHKP